MKIKIENIPAGSETEIVIRCAELDESLIRLVNSAKAASKKLIGITESQLYFIEPRDVYYFEAVDSKVFIYCREKVYESKLKLYEVEDEYAGSDFFRASKSTILNLARIESIKPMFSGRFEALLQNGEKVLISRQYVPALKKMLGL